MTLPTYPSRTFIGSRSGFRSSRLRHRGIEAQLQSTGSWDVYTDKGHFKVSKSSLSYSTVVAISIFLDRFYPTLHVPEAPVPKTASARLRIMRHNQPESRLVVPGEDIMRAPTAFCDTSNN